MTVSYYEFTDSGIKVDLSSIKGGKISVEPSSVKWPLSTEADKRSLKDKKFREKINNSIKIDAIYTSNSDLFYIAGGWGAS